MKYQVTMYADFNYISWGMPGRQAKDLPDNVYLEEQEIMDKVQGEYQGGKCYYVPVANMPKLLSLVAEFNSRKDKTYVMSLEVYNAAE